MSDPLAEMVALLQPAARLVKLVGAAGAWGARRVETGQPSFCAVLDGHPVLTLQGEAPLPLAPGDFVLVPATWEFTMSGAAAPPAAAFERAPLQLGPGEVRHGDPEGEPDTRFVIGHCVFGAPDAALLVSLLPRMVHVRGDARLASLVELVRDESRAQRPARDVVLARLLEVLLIEALRSADGTAAAPGLVRGLADPRLAAALRRIHAQPAQAWTVAELAKESALSRSAFFERFSAAVGMAPMEYLLAWRMALAKDLLRRGACRIAEVAQRVGYSSASTFSVAFTRHLGVPPARFARDGTTSSASPLQ
ncbi:AraC family transcriptional regulator [Massilia sp. KIM]|uniref:AraC family transcriptional regulator n=1 Tax=Massilia sp. KIM TaxID=1955422 RepID=UPI00098F7782|nr:AraC family transcriptional regulator [Massilia sp. KIM]OON63966.1 AraC family transcriptional regulator [Massilia sp. KIM]